MLLGSFFVFFGKTIHRNALSELHMRANFTFSHVW